MKLEDNVCTIEQAKRLVELGVRLKTYFIWSACKELVIRDPRNDNRWYLPNPPGYYYPAPSVTELGVLLPWGIRVNDDDIVELEQYNIYRLLIWKVHNKAFNADYFNDENTPLINRWSSENLSKILTDRVIVLLENEYIKPEELNGN
jgi:hypothetical protein